MSYEVISDQKKAEIACQKATVIPLLLMLLITFGQIATEFLAEIVNRAPSTHSFIWISLPVWAVSGGFILNIFIMKWAAVRGYKAGAAEN